MREIKFREFVNGSYHYWGFTSEGVFKGPATPSLTRGIHQQFTGLKDKNDKEIYEGDITKLPVTTNNSLHGDWALYSFVITCAGHWSTMYELFKKEREKK